MDPMGYQRGQYTHHGGRGSQTEDKGQRVLQDSTKQDSGLEGKQEMWLTRPGMATPLPDEILHEAAKIAVKVLLELWNHLPTLAIIRQKSLSQDARLILDRYQDLQSELQQPSSCIEMEGYALYLHTQLIEYYSREIVLGLSYATCLKLSIIVWHFDPPSCKPSPGPVTSHFNASPREPSTALVAFLRSPLNMEVWKMLHVRYQTMCQIVSFGDFIRSFDFLLSPQLPREPLANQLEFGDSQSDQIGEQPEPCQ